MAWRGSPCRRMTCRGPRSITRPKDWPSDSVCRAHEPTLIRFNERNQAILRQRLALAVLERAWQEGRAMSVAEALAVGRRENSRPRIADPRLTPDA